MYAQYICFNDSANVWNSRCFCISHGGSDSRIRNTCYNISFNVTFKCQCLTHSVACFLNRNSIDYAVRAGKIYIFKNTCLFFDFFFYLKALYFLFIDNNHFSWLNITNKFAVHRINGTAFTGKNIAPFLSVNFRKFSKTKRSDSVWITDIN